VVDRRLPHFSTVRASNGHCGIAPCFLVAPIPAW
jgi:hypothetical protein